MVFHTLSRVSWFSYLEAKRKIYLVEKTCSPVIWTTFHLLRRLDTHQWACKTKIRYRRNCFATHSWQQYSATIHNLWASSTLIFQHRRVEHSDACRISSFVIKLHRDFLRIQNRATLQWKTRRTNITRSTDQGLHRMKDTSSYFHVSSDITAAITQRAFQKWLLFHGWVLHIPHCKCSQQCTKPPLFTTTRVCQSPRPHLVGRPHFLPPQPWR